MRTWVSLSKQVSTHRLTETMVFFYSNMLPVVVAANADLDRLKDAARGAFGAARTKKNGKDGY